jgi:hypothetical protein
MATVRRAVIFVAQILALIFVVVATMAGDGWITNAAPMFGSVLALLPSAPISIAGAVAAFFVSIVLAALFFC